MIRKITFFFTFLLILTHPVSSQSVIESAKSGKKCESGFWKPDKPQSAMKQVDIQASSLNGYVAGETHNVFISVVVANTDFEYVDSLSLTLPSGMTLNSVSNDEFFGPSFDPGGEPEAYNGIDGQTVSWGDNDNFYGGITSQGSEYAFSMNITFDEGLEGDQEVQIHASGDGFGTSPGDLNLTLILNEETDEAGLQIIHNSADLAAAVVDVRVNGLFPDPSLDDLGFRTATGFLTVPATEDLEITINDPSSSDDSNPLFSQVFNLDPGINYQVVATGIVSETGYDPSTPFSLEIFEQAQTQGNNPSNTDIVVFHGSSDAPTVDLFEPFLAIQLISDISYSEYQGYLSLETNDYILQLTLENGTAVVGNFQAPLATLGLEGSAITVLASGFLDPSANQNGPSFGLWAALSSGGPLIELEAEDLAQVQVIHNSADMAASSVDIRINGELEDEWDDLGFRTASPFLPVEAGTPLSITVNAPDSDDDSDPLFTLDIPEGLNSNEKYIIIAEGILSETGYDPGSDEVPFNLNVYNPAGQSSSSGPGNIDVLISHGATDAPPVDINEVITPITDLVANISYGEIADYLELATGNYALEVAVEATGEVVATYTAPLENLGLDGAALTVLASGFLEPTSNSDGPGFGLWAALPSGGPLVELPLYVPNDSPCGAISLNTDGTPQSGSNAGAITDAGEVVPPFGPCEDNFAWCDGEEGGQAEITNTLWYSFQAPASGVVEVTTCNSGTDFDTQVAVWGASDCSDYGTFQFFGANDDFPGGQGCPASTLFASTLLVCGLTEGETYFIQIDGFLGSTGNFSISVEELDASLCTARVQVVHNSPDEAAAVVDVRVNGDFPAPDFDDLEFRVATETIDAPANIPLNISINPSSSVDDENSLFEIENVILNPGSSYQIIAQGIISGEGYEPGSDEAPLDLLIIEGYEESNPNPGNTSVLVVHGSTDAPAVDIDEILLVNAELVGNLAYDQFDGYLDLATQDYQLGITAAGQDDIIAAFDAPLSNLNLEGAAISIFASGFLDPSVNSGGPDFGLWVSLPAGGPLIPLGNITTVENVSPLNRIQLFPNPADSYLVVEMGLSTATHIELKLFDIAGRMVRQMELGERGVGLHREIINMNALSSGVYLLSLTMDQGQITRLVQVKNR